MEDLPNNQTHYVCVPPAHTPRRGGLLMLLSECAVGTNFAKHAASIGFDVVCLSWRNSPGAECACGGCLWRNGRGMVIGPKEESCEHHLELSRLYGAEDEEATELDKATRVEKKYSWWPHTDHRLKRAHAIEGRLLALLYYLIRDDAARWQQYVLENGDGDGEGAAARPYYERLHFAGHSRGTIYGVLLGQRYSLQRIVLLDGPTNRLGNHMSKGRTSVPPWLTYNNSRTRPEDYFGLSCTYGGCHACYDAQPIWHDGLRMPGAANFTNESVWVGGGGTMHAAHMNGQGHHHHHNLSRLLDGARQVYDSGLCQFDPPSDASHMCLLGHLRKGDGRDYHGLTRIWTYLLTEPSSGAGERALLEASNRSKATTCPILHGNVSGWLYVDEERNWTFVTRAGR